MGYAQPGSYMSPYSQQQAWQGPPPWQQQQQWAPPWAQQQQWGPPPWAQQNYAPPPPQQQNLNSSLLGSILPLIIQMPALKNATTVAATLQTQLLALTPPAPINAAPTAAQYNELLNYSVSVKNAVTQATGNDATVFAALKQGLLFQMIGGMGTGGGQDQTMMLVMLMAFGGLTP